MSIHTRQAMGIIKIKISGQADINIGSIYGKRRSCCATSKTCKTHWGSCKNYDKDWCHKEAAGPYLNEKVTKLEYKEGISSFGSKCEQEIREEWDWMAMSDYVEHKIKKTEEFSKLAHKVSSTFGASVGQAEFWISRFLNTISIETLNGASEERIVALTYSFMKDLEDSPKSWTPRVWIKGIWLVEDTLNLTSNINP